MLSPAPDWAGALDALAAALDADDALAAARVRIDPAWGPVPEAHAARAGELVVRMHALERSLAAELDEIGAQLRHRRPSSRHRATPAPSQLDCSA